jgi:hypothetical protein
MRPSRRRCAASASAGPMPNVGTRRDLLDRRRRRRPDPPDSQPLPRHAGRPPASAAAATAKPATPRRHPVRVPPQATPNRARPIPRQGRRAVRGEHQWHRPAPDHSVRPGRLPSGPERALIPGRYHDPVRQPGPPPVPGPPRRQRPDQSGTRHRHATAAASITRTQTLGAVRRSLTLTVRDQRLASAKRASPPFGAPGTEPVVFFAGTRKDIRFTGWRRVMGRRSTAQIIQQRLRALARPSPGRPALPGRAARRAPRPGSGAARDPAGQAGPLPLWRRPFQVRISVVATRNAIFPGNGWRAV